MSEDKSPEQSSEQNPEQNEDKPEENGIASSPVVSAGAPASYAEVWAAAALETIQSLTGDPRWQQAPAPAESGDPVVEIVAFVELSGACNGIQQMKLHRSDGRAWAQLLVPPGADAPRTRSSPLDDAERDALADVLRRIVSAAAAGLQAHGWGEVTVELRHLGPLRRAVESASNGETLSFAHPEGPRLGFTMSYDAALREQVGQRPHTEAEHAAAGVRAHMTSTTRFDMLLDVELDVTLRFGNRQMLLHDIAELTPGSVLELDRQIDDPVELLVGGKIIAWGEVVVVDGNYGLRVNRLVHRRERMAAVEAAQ
ncbi:MAG: FliM/FliN family flagellar motor switch protein [Terriglobales bacterium]